jgi:hypothetical protein
MVVQPQVTCSIAAAAVIAAAFLVVFGSNDEVVDPTAPLRALARACELSERVQRRLHVLEQMRVAGAHPKRLGTRLLLEVEPTGD